MSTYPVTWITPSLAVGYAPMSYADLDVIRDSGVDAIVNLCAEFSDLHEIEIASGFEVYYLPIWDEDVPEMKEMEKALAWLDEAVYLGKRVLVHCRHGIGRTGTFVTSYMIRKGMSLKAASKKLKTSSANPSNYGQWKLLKKYGKTSGILKIREPSLEVTKRVDLGRFFRDYEALIARIDQELEHHRTKAPGPCGQNQHPCCSEPFELQFMEVVYLHSKMNRHLTSGQRNAAIERAIRKLKDKTTSCPLNRGNGCEIYEFRPVRCRVYEMAQDHFLKGRQETEELVIELSRAVFLAFSGEFLSKAGFTFSVAETVSGKFVQAYFNAMSGRGNRNKEI